MIKEEKKVGAIRSGKVCAVMVTYFPEEEVIENINTLMEQVDMLIVVDNGSDSKSKKILENLGGGKINILYLPNNLGIAAALNLGIREAKSNGYSWVATLDQDSLATPRMFEIMQEAYYSHPEKEKVICLSPCYKDKNTGVICSSNSYLGRHASSRYLEVDVTITSGALMKASIFDTIGYFDEGLFIDYVDTEFCLRCTTIGYKLLEVPEVILLHRVGTPSQHRFLWKTVTTNNHNALRRYYFARNAIYIYRKYLFKHPLWVIRNFYVLVNMFILVVLFEKERKHKLFAFFVGIRDGLLGKMGKCERRL